MNRRLLARLLSTCAFLVLLSSASLTGAAQPTVLPTAPAAALVMPPGSATFEVASTFAERALADVVLLSDDIGPRPAGSEPERRAADWIAEQLRAAGYLVEVTPFTFSAGSSSGVSQNVVATREETGVGPLVIIGAHYDSVPQSPGANDNASGTATMLGVARALAENPVPGVDVRYVAFGAEEIGLLGSKEYVRNLSAADRARTRVMMSLDMLAVGDQPAFGGSEPWLSEALARAASQGYRPAQLSSFLRRMSDHASFLDANIDGIMFHWVDDPNYHTRFDVSQFVQPYSMQLMGDIAIELVRVAARP